MNCSKSNLARQPKRERGVWESTASSQLLSFWNHLNLYRVFVQNGHTILRQTGGKPLFICLVYAVSSPVSFLRDLWVE
jgi:hypothetical protein